jgi:hypothetical protein
LTRKWLVRGIIAAIVVFLGFKIIRFFTAKLVPHKNYVEVFNELTCHGDYENFADDPNNAFCEYVNAYQYFVRFPRIIEDAPYIDWPGDFNEIQQKRLESWLILNEVSLKAFHNAVNKPYYWRNRYSDDDSMMGMRLDGLSETRQLVEAACWQAKYQAWRGNYQKAFEIILDCYKAGRQFTDGRRMLAETLFGCNLKRQGLVAGFLVLSQTNIDSQSLSIFKQRLEEIIKTDSVKIDFGIEKLSLYDIVQRMFHQNKDDDGKLAFRYFRSVDCLCDEGKYRMLRYIMHSFIGPTSSEMKQKIDDYLRMFESVSELTPYQVFLKDPNYFKKLELEQQKDLLLDLVATNYEKSLAGIRDI